MKNVCRFNLKGGGVLEVEPDKIVRITGNRDIASHSYINVGGLSYSIFHSQEEAQAIWDAAKPPTVAPDKRRSLLDAANAIHAAFDWDATREGFDKWNSIHNRLIILGRGEPL